MNITKTKFYTPYNDTFDSEKEKQMAITTYNEKVKDILRYTKWMNPNKYILTKSNLHVITYLHDGDFENAFVLMSLAYVSPNNIPYFNVISVTESFEEAITWIKEK
jgi:hypothetical protein